MVRKLDARADVLRDLGAEVVVGRTPISVAEFARRNASAFTPA